MNNLLVSVVCTTYNHEKYIKDAIEGFLLQKTNFSIEIIIHDDASIDNTANIVREYENKYPKIIKPIYQKENQYSKGVEPLSNYVWPKCSGKYIAFCEGDDYWTDPYKLQKQVDFMEANEDYILCFTNCSIADEKGNIVKDNRIEEREEKTYTHLDMPIFAPTLTRLFRNKYLDVIPKSFESAPGGDAYLLVWQSKFGKIKYCNYNSAVYRVTKQGAWSGLNDFQKQCLSFKTFYAILDITEKDVREKFICELFDTLKKMRKKVSTDSENLICKSFYNEMLGYFKNRKKLNSINLFAYNRVKLSLIIYYYYDSLLIKVVRSIMSGFVKAALRKY